MSTLIAIIVAIAYPFLFYLCWTDNPQIRKRLNIRITRNVYIINTISLLFCCVYYIISKLQLGSHTPQVLVGLSIALAFPAFFVILLRILFLPYVHTILWTIVYIKFLKEDQFPKKETFHFAIMLLLSILGLVCLELAFQGMLRI